MPKAIQYKAMLDNLEFWNHTLWEEAWNHSKAKEYGTLFLAEGYTQIMKMALAEPKQS